jgi:branched-chain amino acid transport system substrate-binding protein
MLKRIILAILVSLICLPLTAMAADEVKIGFHTPLTGWAAADGKSALQGAQLAVEMLNASGGINGKKIKLVYYDDRVESKESVIVARKLIESDQVVGVVSGSYSTPTRSAAPIYNQNKMPYISTIGTHPEIPINRKYVFQTAISSPIHGHVCAKAAAVKLKAKTAVMLDMDNDFGIAASDGFRKMAAKFGIKIINEYKYPLGEKDFRSLLGNIKKDDPDVLWATGYYEEAARIAKQSKEVGIRATILGQEGYDSPKFFELGGEATNGVIITTNLDRGSDRAVTKEFLNAYMEKNKIAADMVAASAFDGIKLMAAAIKEVGTNNDKIISFLAGVKDYEDAATGPLFSFDSQGRVTRAIPAQIVKNKAFTSFYVSEDLELITP